MKRLVLFLTGFVVGVLWAWTGSFVRDVRKAMAA